MRYGRCGAVGGEGIPHAGVVFQTSCTVGLLLRVTPRTSSWLLPFASPKDKRCAYRISVLSSPRWSAAPS